MVPALPLRSAYEFGKQHGLQNEIEEIRDMPITWDRSYRTSVRRGYIVDLFEKKAIFDEFKKRHWPIGNSTEGGRKRDKYLRLKSEFDIYLNGKDEDGDPEEDEGEESSSSVFGLERDLRNYLERNLSRIEPGLKLYDAKGRSGVEFHVDNGFIDILAVDKSGRLVVIELKVSKGRNRTVGQLLYYMGWVDQNLLTNGACCRGIIIANEIPTDLRIAVQRTTGISLYKYNLSVTVEAIPSNH